MSISNEDIASAFERIADILEEQDDNLYRVRAYRRAAISVRKYPQLIADLVKNNFDLSVIPNVGEKLAEKIKKIVISGGPASYPKLHLPRPYSDNLKNRARPLLAIKISSAIWIMEKILRRLKEMPEIDKVESASDYRRKKDVVGDIDIVIVTGQPRAVFEKFHKFPSLKYIISTDEYKTVVELKIGIQISLHVVSAKSFGAQLLKLTGSYDHYRKIQEKATDKNFLLTSEGLFENNIKIAGESELEIYQKLTLEFILPELRENRGEIEKAEKISLPKLVELSDIKGDLHVHTNETDGSFTLEEMVSAAQAQGYLYVAITDHSKSLRIARGMDEKRLLNQIKQIDRLNEKLFPFVILKSMEVDILEDGSLDLSNDVLKELDLTVCSIHSKFKISFKKQTERLLRAMDNPYFNILGHATGRIIRHRPPYQFDMEAVLKGAKERNCIIEVNAQPARLDIHDLYCRAAKEFGVKVAISSDSHRIKDFSFMILGVNQARRGWLEASDVINTYPLAELKKLLKRN